MRDGEMSLFDFLSGLTADFSFKAISFIGAALVVLLSAAFVVGKYFSVR
jgi:hypothetical protein